MIGGFSVRAVVPTSPVTKPGISGPLEVRSADFGPTRTLGEPYIRAQAMGRGFRRILDMYGYYSQHEIRRFERVLWKPRNRMGNGLCSSCVGNCTGRYQRHDRMGDRFKLDHYPISPCNHQSRRLALPPFRPQFPGCRRSPRRTGYHRDV